MPFEYRIDTEAGVVYEDLTGEITGADLFEAVQRQEADPLWDYNYNGFTDLSKATLNIESRDIRERADHHVRKILPGCRRWAFFAPTDVQYGMSRMLQSMSDDGHTDVRIFRDRDEAIEWVLHGSLPDDEE